MQLTEISLILPVRNLEREISSILRWAAGQTEGREAEFIVVDMGSADRTVLEAVQQIKELKLRGFVIQNGESTVAAALNTGIQKAGGEYITFLFARRLYRNFIGAYLDTAARTSADIVFGSTGMEESHVAEHKLLNKMKASQPGSCYVKSVLQGNLHLDISALLIKNKYLFEKKIRFLDSCSYGYAEEFVFHSLLLAEVIAQSPVVLKRETEYEMKREKQQMAGKNIFQHADALLRVLDLVKAVSRDDEELIALFEQQKLPLTVMNGVDVMLREGVGYNAVRGYLHVAGYDKFLKTGRKTEKSLKHRIKLWQFIPWMYQPK